MTNASWHIGIRYWFRWSVAPEKWSLIYSFSRKCSTVKRQSIEHWNNKYKSQIWFLYALHYSVLHYKVIISRSSYETTRIAKFNQLFNNFSFDVAVVTSDCNTTLTGFSGIIQTPNYPYNYPNGVSCTWIVEATMSSNINASFMTFDVEPPSIVGRPCDKDMVTVIKKKQLPCCN